MMALRRMLLSPVCCVCVVLLLLCMTCTCEKTQPNEEPSGVGGSCTQDCECRANLICAGQICVRPQDVLEMDTRGIVSDSLDRSRGCEPECGAKQCGPDGCGGVCGTCTDGFVCDWGQCVEVEPCGNGICDPAEDHDSCPDDCACVPVCSYHECGADGCGGVCGMCRNNESCKNGRCVWTAGEYAVVCEEGMCLVPAGNFWRGCNDTVDLDCWFNESPYHEVYLDAFWIDRSEVTKKQYDECVGTGACPVPSSNVRVFSAWTDDPDTPVVGVNWQDAADYCQWAGKRLPTEAEWEKAARGTDGRKYPWGNEDYKCYEPESTYEGMECIDTTPWAVCSKPKANTPYGLCDMAGNVWEWTADWYDGTYYYDSPDSNPGGPAAGLNRVVRGGTSVSAFNHLHLYDSLRTSARNDADPSTQGVTVGFRCARDAAERSE